MGDGNWLEPDSPNPVDKSICSWHGEKQGMQIRFVEEVVALSKHICSTIFDVLLNIWDSGLFMSALLSGSSLPHQDT